MLLHVCCAPFETLHRGSLLFSSFAFLCACFVSQQGFIDLHGKRYRMKPPKSIVISISWLLYPVLLCCTAGHVMTLKNKQTKQQLSLLINLVLRVSKVNFTLKNNDNEYLWAFQGHTRQGTKQNLFFSWTITSFVPWQPFVDLISMSMVDIFSFNLPSFHLNPVNFLLFEHHSINFNPSSVCVCVCVCLCLT